MDPRGYGIALAGRTGRLVLLAAVSLAMSRGSVAPERYQQGAPVAGVVAIVSSDAPSDDVYATFVCAGALISEVSVITAAHCVDGASTALDVLVRADNLCRSGQVDGYRVHVGEIHIHPQYDGPSARWDVALLTLSRPLSRSELLPVADVWRNGQSAMAYGWGRVDSSGASVSCRLVATRLTLVAQSDCGGMVGTGPRAFDPESMLCASPVNGQRDTCVGDSGGPLVVSGPSHDAVIGVVSWGNGCLNSVGVYARAEIDATGRWPSAR